jgi:sugar phosphate isomerase/epimerase
VKACVSTWNWLKPMGTDARLLPALEEAAAGGFGVELWLDWTPEPGLFDRSSWPALLSACRNSAGLSLHSRLIHRFDPATIREEIDLAAFIGADPLVVHPRSLGLESGTWDACLRRTIDSSALAVIAGILSYARERSVRLALENGAMDVLQAVADAFPADGADGPGSRLGICIDTGHANLHRDLFANPAAAYLRAFADRLVHLHVSDNLGTGDDHLVPGTGTIDWRSIADALRRIGYRGTIVLELAEPGPAEAARRAAGFLHAVGIGAG